MPQLALILEPKRFFNNLMPRSVPTELEAQCNGMVVGLWETGKEDEKKPRF
jgi:hypothetical protein